LPAIRIIFIVIATTNIKGAKIIKANFKTNIELVAIASIIVIRINSISTALAGLNNTVVLVPEDGT
jgi:hypothetical protein